VSFYVTGKGVVDRRFWRGLYPGGLRPPILKFSFQVGDVWFCGFYPALPLNGGLWPEGGYVQSAELQHSSLSRPTSICGCHVVVPLTGNVNNCRLHPWFRTACPPATVQQRKRRQWRYQNFCWGGARLWIVIVTLVVLYGFFGWVGGYCASLLVQKKKTKYVFLCSINFYSSLT